MIAPLHDLALRVGYRDLRDYVAARGWTHIPSRRDYAAIYRTPGSGAVEIQIPLDTSLADYADAMILAARRVASFEGRDTEQVLRDLLEPHYDVLRYALVGVHLRTGSIDLLTGSSLINGAVKSLRASACSAQQPRRFHPRMTLSDAESYIHACRLGQTEIGSYVLTIDAPLDVHERVEASDEVPFGRRATSVLLASTAYIASSIRRGDHGRILEDRPDAPLVSANLCEALVEMMPPDESADLRLSGSWSPLVPPPPSAETDILLDRTMFEPIEHLAQQLRPARESEPGRFVGKVVELSGAPSATGDLEGDVVLQVQTDEQLLKVRATLDPDAYRNAGLAHFEQRYVSIRGRLHRGRRTSVLLHPSDLVVLPP